MKEPKFPPIPLVLLEALEHRFPDRMPPKERSLEDIRFSQGEVNVIRVLRREFDKQNENILQ